MFLDFCCFQYFHFSSDKPGIIVFKIILLSIPNLIDFILTALNFSKECAIYFILRFVTQALYIYFCVALYGCIFIKIKDKEYCIDPFCSFCFGSCFVLLMEIPSLIIFISNYDKIYFLAKIGYYIHLVYIPIMIFLILYYACKYNPSYWD